MGNPNVGKSVIFSRLTGIEVVSANYPGTTVEYTEGRMKLGEQMATLVDAPGVYSLDPTSNVEEVTRQIFAQGADVIVNVIDSTNLERNLNLTLQILEWGLPTVVALNLWDVATHKGIEIDTSALENELGISVVPTVAVSGQGIFELVEALALARPPPPVHFDSSDQRWARIGEIAGKTQKVLHRHPSIFDKLEDISIKPLTGIPIALLVLYLSFSLVIEVGELLQQKITDPIFFAYSQFISAVVESHISSALLREILIGTSPELLKSFGILTTGLYIPFGVVLPFLIPFYLVLGILEDIGYLPRLSVILDALHAQDRPARSRHPALRAGNGMQRACSPLGANTGVSQAEISGCHSHDHGHPLRLAERHDLRHAGPLWPEVYPHGLPDPLSPPL